MNDKTESDGTYTAPKEGWTCYHCGETFIKPGAASDHFGEVPRDKKPKCQYHDLDVEKLEKEVERQAKRIEEILGTKGSARRLYFQAKERIRKLESECEEWEKEDENAPCSYCEINYCHVCTDRQAGKRP